VTTPDKTIDLQTISTEIVPRFKRLDLQLAQFDNQNELYFLSHWFIKKLAHTLLESDPEQNQIHQNSIFSMLRSQQIFIA